MIQLDFYGTLVAASLVLLLGRGLVSRIGVLRNFNIPEPVAGGLLVAMFLLMLRTFDIEVRFDTSLQAPLMLAFFATIGLSADFASLRKGGARSGNISPGGHRASDIAERHGHRARKDAGPRSVDGVADGLDYPGGWPRYRGRLGNGLQ